MIRPLRIRHRRMATAGAVLVPLGLAAALSVRPVDGTDGTDLPGDALTAAELPLDGPFERVFVRDFGPWGGLPLTALLGLGADQSRLVEFQPTGPLLHADLLVYWRPPGAPVDELSNRALLLGRLTESPRRFVLPDAGAAGVDGNGGDGGGDLVLFDLARGEVIATRDLPTLLE